MSFLTKPALPVPQPGAPLKWKTGLGVGSLFLPNPEIQPVHPKGNKSVLNIHWKDWCWSWNSDLLAIWCEELTPWKRPRCWERSKAGGEGEDRGWDGWMASLTRWTWAETKSGSWWWTGRPGLLQSMGSPRVRHDWATELNWLKPNIFLIVSSINGAGKSVQLHVQKWN